MCAALGEIGAKLAELSGNIIGDCMMRVFDYFAPVQFHGGKRIFNFPKTQLNIHHERQQQRRVSKLY
jgi:hypothetical protein